MNTKTNNLQSDVISEILQIQSDNDLYYYGQGNDLYYYGQGKVQVIMSNKKILQSGQGPSDNVKWVGQGPSDNVKQKNITKWARSK